MTRDDVIARLKSLEPQIREIERIVQEQIETPPAECLALPPPIGAMPDWQDWRQRAADMTEAAQIRDRVIAACQGWWGRVEAERVRSARGPIMH